MVSAPISESFQITLRLTNRFCLHHRQWRLYIDSISFWWGYVPVWRRRFLFFFTTQKKYYPVPLFIQHLLRRWPSSWAGMGFCLQIEKSGKCCVSGTESKVISTRLNRPCWHPSDWKNSLILLGPYWGQHILRTC